MENLLMSALTISKEDEKRVNEVNKVTNIIKEKIKPLIKYIIIIFIFRPYLVLYYIFLKFTIT